MDYELSDAHKLIRDAARRIAREKVAPRAAELDESGEYPQDIFGVFAEAGLLGLTIPEQYGGSDAANLESRARRDGDDYIIDGEKVFISGGSVADYVCFFAKTAEDGASAISGIIVPTDSPGYSVPRCDRKMGVMGVPTANIVLRECRVSAANRIGDEGRGFRTAMLTLNTCRPVVGARGLGLAEGCIAYALDYARERKTFGVPLVDHQAIQFMLADAAIEIEASRHLVYHAATLVDQGKYDRQHAPYLSMAKTMATE